MTTRGPWLARQLVRLFPRRFTQVWGDDMMATVAARHDEARRTGGYGRVARFWARTILDIAYASAAERWHSSLDPSWILDTHRHGRTPMSRTGAALSTLADDIKLAVRRVRARPGVSFTSVATLACAVGAAAATWSLLSAVLLHPFPVREPERLVVVGAVRADIPGGPVSDAHLYPLYPLIRERGVFASIAAGGSSSELIAVDDVPQRGTVFYASFDYFDALGTGIPRGRAFTIEDDRRGAPLVAIASDRFWKRRLNGDPNVVGRTVHVANKPVLIIGVAPPGLRGLRLAEAPDLFLPLHAIGDVSDYAFDYFVDGTSRSSPSSWVRIVGRLQPRQSVEQAAAALNGLPTEGVGRKGRAFVVTDVTTAALPETARASMARFTRLLGATVGLLLLIGCLTVGMLLLVRTEARRDEFAMCLALGATRWRLARSIAIDGALLAVAGAALAFPVAHWLFDGVRAFQLPGGIDIDLLNLGIDARVLAAATAAAALATLLIAVVAGSCGFSTDVADVLRSRSGGTSRLTRRRTRTALVSAQIAAALVLVAGAGLFTRSLIESLRLNPGFETTRLLTGTFSLGAYQYSPARARTFFDDLFARLTPNPAIASVAYACDLGGMTPSGRIPINGEARQFPSLVAYRSVDEHYFRTIGLRVTTGRDFAETDTSVAPLVVIVSASFGRQLANGGNPIGARITQTSGRAGQPPGVMEVVGVVPDVITNVAVMEPLVMYRPLAQDSYDLQRTLVVRAAGDPAVATRDVTNAIKQIDPLVTPSPLLTIDERIGRQMSPQRFGALVLGALGTIALLLAVLGTYVLAESMAVARRREMGIRAALGASARQLHTLVLADTTRLVAVGLSVGLLLAWLGSSTIGAFLFRVQPLDPATLAGAAALILLLALGVALRPALAAGRVDLAELLRE